MYKRFTEEQCQEAECALSPGEYEATVTDVIDAPSRSSGNAMWTVNLSVDRDLDRKPIKIKDYITFDPTPRDEPNYMDRKLRRFASSAGLEGEYEDERLEHHMFVGRVVNIRTKVEKGDAGSFPKVAEYIVVEPATPEQHLADEDVPF